MRRGWTKKKKKCGVVTEGERKCVRVCIEGERMYVFARVYEGPESVVRQNKVGKRSGRALWRGGCFSQVRRIIKAILLRACSDLIYVGDHLLARLNDF